MMVRRLIFVAAFLLSAGVTFWLSLVYTIHLGTVSVPDLVGKSQEEAETLSHDQGLKFVLDEGGVFNESAPIGAIGAQQPPGGFHLKSGSEVHVRLSLGNEKTSVPDLEGLSMPAAVQKLEESGLRLGRRAEVSGEGNADTIIAASPEFGRILPPQKSVGLLINHIPPRPLWVMPRLISRRLSVVQRFVKNHRLRIGRLHEVEYPGFPRGLILQQYPPAGSPFSPSDIISLWVSQ